MLRVERRRRKIQDVIIGNRGKILFSFVMIFYDFYDDEEGCDLWIEVQRTEHL